MQPLTPAPPLRPILNNLAERAVMLDETQADLERASTRAGFLFPLKVNTLVDLPRVVAEGPTIEAVLRYAFPDFLEYARAGYSVQFQRRAAPPVTLKLSDLIGSGAVLAVTDYETAGGGMMWMPTIYQGRRLATPDIAFYLVWPGQPQRPSFWDIKELDLIPPQ